MTRFYVRDPLQATERRCSRCGTVRSISAFRILRGRWPSSWCKPCSLARTQQWREEHRDEINARRREQYATGGSPSP